VYWDRRFPRILTKKQIRNIKKTQDRGPFCIADISCDVNGSVEFVSKTTSIDQPFYVYNPATDNVSNDLGNRRCVRV